MNFCSREGWVVDGRDQPGDPIDHDAGRLPLLGCTNIRCSSCGEKVRTIGNKDIEDIAGMDARALFALPDLASSPLLGDSTWRVYVCRCNFHQESTQHPLDDLDGGVSVAGQWKCAGHPLATLPHTFDGVEVRADNLETLAAQALAGTTPPGARSVDQKKANWIARLCVRLEGTPHATALAAAIASRLTDADVMTRTRAVRVFTTVGRHTEVMAMDALLGAHASLYVGVRDAFADVDSEPTLEHAVWRLASLELARNPALRDLAHAAALDPARVSYALMLSLVRGDPAWFSDHAEDLARAHPTRIDDLADAASDAPSLRPVIARIRAAARS